MKKCCQERSDFGVALVRIAGMLAGTNLEDMTDKEKAIAKIIIEIGLGDFRE
jgi:hypothetical protein